MRRSSRRSILILLTFLWLLPVATTVLAWFDANHWHYLLRVRRDLPTLEGVPITETNLQRLKQSILNVQVPSCEGDGGASGTAFVLSRGYVATAAHVVKDHQACGSQIALIDYRGLTHRAELSAYSDETELDLAILQISDIEFDPLEMADSTLYEDATGVVQVMTIGYPRGSSASDEAAISGVGSLSSYRAARFFTSGMDLNPGNSGGPVFVTDDWTVLGVATHKGDPDEGTEGLGVVVPSAELVRFFGDRTGRSL